MRRSSRDCSPTGGASRPYADRTIDPRRPPGAGERRFGGAKLAQRNERRVAEPLGLLLDAVGRVDGAAAQTAFGEVDARPSDARVRRAEKGVQLAPAAPEPGEAEQREQRVPERRRREAQPRLDRERDAERRERRLERCPPALDRRDDDRDRLGRRAVAQQTEQLVADELDRAPGPGALEEADGAADRRRLGGGGLEERALEVRERRRRVLRRAGGELLDAAAGERARSSAVRRSEANAVAARLVGQRDVDVRPPGERLEQRPLRRGQVLEPVGEDGLAVPGAEIAEQALAGAAPEQVAVPEPERSSSRR